MHESCLSLGTRVQRPKRPSRTWTIKHAGHLHIALTPSLYVALLLYVILKCNMRNRALTTKRLEMSLDVDRM